MNHSKKESLLIHFLERSKWRTWLKKHHDSENEVWLLFYKKQSGILQLSYDDAVEEALCFGWIDSIIKRIDNETYKRKFTPRTNTMKWSGSNIQRVKKLIKIGGMTEAGLAKIPKSILKAKQNHRVQSLDYSLSNNIREILLEEKSAYDFYLSLSPSYRNRYDMWIMSAKKEETRIARAHEAIRLLKQRVKSLLK